MMVAVLGLGNVLMGDDALGPYVIRVLEASYVFPPDVAVVDVGTPGLDLTPYLCDLKAAILIDTVGPEGPAGELRSYRKEQILRCAPQPRLGPHDPGLKEALLTLELAGRAPGEVLLVGVIPGEVKTGVGLTPAVGLAVPRVVAEVVRELARLGAAPEPRVPAAEPEIWWEAPPQGVRADAR